jgi:hypothetical protein
VITESSPYSPVPSFVAVDPHPQADAGTIVRTTIPNPLSALMESLHSRDDPARLCSWAPSDGPTAANELEHDDNERDDQQEMD